MFYYVASTAKGKVGYGIVTDRFLCAVGELGSPDALTRLWDLLRGDDAHLEDVLSLFAANGIAKIPPFALVELVDVPTGSIALAVRGAGEVEVAGRDVGPYTGAGAATWVEGAAQQVSGLSIGFGAAVAGAELPLLRGVVRTDRLHWRPDGAPTSAVPVDASVATDDDAIDRADASADDVVDDDRTELPDWARPGSVPSASAATPPPAPPVAPTPAPPSTVAEPDDDDADRTIVMSSRRGAVVEAEDKTVLAAPRRRTAEASALPPFELVFADGSAVDLGRTVLIGRKPKAPVGPPIRLVTVTSPTSEVSSSHAEFSAVDGGVLVRDADSTNGSIIRQPGREPFLLRGGETLTVVAGTEVDLGDSNVVVVRAV